MDEERSTPSPEVGKARQKEELQNRMSDVPFEVLQRAKADGFTARNKHSSSSNGKETTNKRLNKNRPMEMSSKTPVSIYRDVIQAPKQRSRDPRFESLCGTFDENRFKKSYKFIYDENLPMERQRVFESMKKMKDPELKKQAEKQLAAIDRQLKAEADRRKLEEKSNENRKKEHEQVQQGKKPYFIKKSDQRKEGLIEKFEELKKTGKLEAYLEKRRRKNATKDRRYMPYKRPQDN